MQFDMVFVGQKLDGVTEVDVLMMFNIAEHVKMCIRDSIRIISGF